MKYYKLFVDGTNSFFTYSDEKEQFNIGDRVAVNFRNRERGALVIEEDKSETFDFKVFGIKRKLENEISLSPKYIELLLWISRYYLCNFSTVLSAALPKELKIKYSEFYSLNLSDKEYDESLEYFFDKLGVTKPTLRKTFELLEIKDFIENKILIEIKDKKYILDFTKHEELENKEKYQDIYNYFIKRNRFSKKTIDEKFEKKVIDRLIENKKLIYEKKISEREFEELEEIKKITSKDVELTERQKEVVENIENLDKKYFLIRGITGSGKTEVYIKLIKDALKEKKGSIFLVPEISLTPQMKDRFAREFGEEVAVLHSNISDKDKQREWLSIISGEKKVVLGARSAIFAPVKNLAYIIVDEEHENSYKQDTNPRYNAKYVAIKKAILEDCKVVLGSATPDVELSLIHI